LLLLKVVIRYTKTGHILDLSKKMSAAQIIDFFGFFPEYLNFSLCLYRTEHGLCFKQSAVG
jgi:hypothetical protein